MSEKTKDEKNNSTFVTTNLPPDVKKAGILRKLKTMKKKFFVLRTESDSGPARLEYYDSEKKFRSGINPKRSIVIKNCFNINRKIDAKQKHAIALYTKDDCFSVVAENEYLLDEWLKAMLELQLEDNLVNGDAALKPKFEHVWQVTVGEKSLACKRNMKGLYRLCLTNKSLALVKMDQTDDPETLEFPLMSIRRCGHSNNYFLIELGRSSITGEGELWLETEDVVIAQNMHEVTLNAMKTCREHEDLGPHRPRSSSNTETSRPITSRRPVAVVNAQPNYPSIRDRCDSMPSRPRTISEGQEITNRCSYTSPSHPLDPMRPHGSFSRYVMSYSPPGVPNPLSPSSTACSTDSAGSSLSIDEYDGGPSEFNHSRFSHSIPTDNTMLTEPTIKEEQLDDYLPMFPNANTTTETSGYLSMAPIYSSSAPTGPSLALNINPIEVARLHSASTASQNSEYVEMTSPMSPPGDYMSMSPQMPTNNEIKILNTDNGRNNSFNNNTPKTTEGYMYMAPASSSPSCQNESYLDMAPLSSSLPKTTNPLLSGNIDIFALKDNNYGVSDTSMTSSPDITKSEEYQLDKVKSLLTQTQDTSEDYIRPVRAYSMGSRPQPKKTHLTIHDESCRMRAYSVGSQASAAKNKSITYVDRDYGSIKCIDIRTGAKSSSAPLLHNRPPRMRTSTSRADMCEDLMEIDYNKSSTLQDKDFTIEPVGRNRSGSYSSSFSDKIERKGKLIYERDKGNLNLSGGSLNSSDNVHDYLSMSPLSDSSCSSSVKSTSSIHIKPVEHYHPPGDYVSLNPSVKYSSSPSNPIKSILSQLSNTSTNLVGNGYEKVDSSSPKLNRNVKTGAVFNNFNAAMDNTKSSSISPKNIKRFTSDSTESPQSDYVCMNYNSSAKESSPIGTPKNVNSFVNLNFPRSPSGPAALNQLVKNFVPKTPPPSPQSGIISSDTSSIDEPLMRNLAQHLSKSMNHSAPNSRPTSLCKDLRLNYASLDLPPSTEEDTTLIMPVHRMRTTANVETKEVPLTYAQIDFSSAPQEAFKESYSHL